MLSIINLFIGDVTYLKINSSNKAKAERLLLTEAVKTLTLNGYTLRCKIKPSLKIPFELTLIVEAVRNQKEDMPYDSTNPLCKFGFGLS